MINSPKYKVIWIIFSHQDQRIFKISSHLILSYMKNLIMIMKLYNKLNNRDVQRLLLLLGQKESKVHLIKMQQICKIKWLVEVNKLSIIFKLSLEIEHLMEIFRLMLHLQYKMIYKSNAIISLQLIYRKSLLQVVLDLKQVITDNLYQEQIKQVVMQ
jgi:hypothetical protein